MRKWIKKSSGDKVAPLQAEEVKTGAWMDQAD